MDGQAFDLKHIWNVLFFVPQLVLYFVLMHNS